MKQIVDKLNKIAKKINENVELSDRDLIIDSLDSITKAYGGTPNDSTLIVDKLDDIYNNIGSTPSGNIEITENGENINVAPFATATVNVAGGGSDIRKCTVTVQNTSANIGYAGPLSFDENGCLVSDAITIPGNGSKTLNYVVEYDNLLHAYVPADFWNSFNNVDFEGSQPAFTDLVNVTVNESFQPLITDPTTDASFTVRVGFTPHA